MWDHAQQRHVIAHDYLISNYVCPSGSHYPIEWRRFRKKDSCPRGVKDHTTLCLDLIDDALSRDIPGDFTFDSYFTHAKILNHLHAKQRHYVGALKRLRRARPSWTNRPPVSTSRHGRLSGRPFSATGTLAEPLFSPLTT